jgi:crotonobetainyl-CoA:carnitine CoA-transferase CaiB-like acyl-CoA transferase
MPASALAGIRVIDFGHYVAGPLAAMLLGDFGADVIRVDPPGGPRFDTPANATWNRNKRSIALDLKQAADRDIALRLIDSADVLMENFRPGVMARLGLGAREMTARNARLVYLSLPGFHANDARAAMPAWEGVLGAATGCFSTNPLLKLDHPVYNCLPIPSTFGALWGAMAVVAALNEREHAGSGQIIEAPLYAAAFSAFSGKAMRVHGQPERAALSTFRHVLCKDGKWFLYVPRDMHKILARDFAFEIPAAGIHAPEVMRRTEDIFASRTAAEWEAYCISREIEGSTCNTTLEWMNLPLARESGTVQAYHDPLLGTFSGLGLPIRLSATPASVRAPRPRLDAHRQEILAALSAQAATQQARELTTAAAPRTGPRGALEGVRVLDLGVILAIPSCGRTLVEFGADVIKIDSPHRNPVPWHNDVNRGKRSLLLDLKTPAGLEIFWRLLENADVVLENFRTGVADKLGIGYKAVRARKPGIIYCSVNAYGETPGHAERPGREVLIQALTGMQTRYGGAKPAQNPLNATDYATGLGAALGIALALLHRSRTGQGQYVTGALIYSGTLLQSSLLQDHAGKQWNDPGGLDCRGRGPLYRAYQASDGWIFVAAREGDLARCPVLADAASLRGDGLERALEARFRERTVTAWETLLRSAGIAAHRVALDFASVMQEPAAIEQGLSLTRHHPGQGTVTTNGPGIRLSRTPLTPGRPTPMPGTGAASILAEIGMADELDRLMKEGVLVTQGVEPGGAS